MPSNNDINNGFKKLKFYKIAFWQYIMNIKNVIFHLISITINLYMIFTLSR